MDEINLTGFGGVRLSAVATGSPENPPVLLIPSLSQTRDMWRACAEALAQAGRYAITVDLRGRGNSDPAPDGAYKLDVIASDLRAILAALPTRACVVAAGLGAIASIVAIGEGAPDLVSGLALVDSTIWFDADMIERSRAVYARRAEGFANVEEIFEAIAQLYPNEPRLMARESVLAAYEVGEDGRYHWRDGAALSSLDIVNEEDRLRSAAEQIRVPVALIRGALNETVSEEAMERLAALIPEAEATAIEGAGHFAPIERQDTFNAVLLDFLERRAPREPLSYVGGSEPRILRNALGCFGTGVTVITSVTDEGELIGLTANSFTSVSLDPPLILFSLDNRSGSMEALRKAGRFAVNVMHIGQQPIANRFASRIPDKFEGVDWESRADGGSPILPGSLASFDCTTHAIHDGGDHQIFIGRVHHAWFEPRRDPLLYFRGKYRRLHFA
ncbi:MAG TPA: alpha/beta fold hydrolase [Sphingobium sp.]|nr:alpha/beta fold hydrolase [Sphingobium sp.]